MLANARKEKKREKLQIKTKQSYAKQIESKRRRDQEKPWWS
jgi:hypothetical protein